MKSGRSLKTKMALGHLDMQTQEVSGSRMEGHRETLSVRLVTHWDRLPRKHVVSIPGSTKRPVQLALTWVSRGDWTTAPQDSLDLE